MNIEDIKEAIEVLEDASAEMLIETGDKDYYSEAIAILRQAVKQAEQKTAVSPDGGKGFIDGVWHCQCGKTYEVTCISSNPAKSEWIALTDQEISDAIDDALEGGGWLDVARALEAAIKRKNA